MSGAAWVRLVLTLGGLLAAFPSLAKDAEIVSLLGKGDHRQGLTAAWLPAKIGQDLNGGWFVRTGDQSRMGILFTDRTQIRLNQNSQLQIKSVADAKNWKQTTIRLQSGRAWSQARPVSGPAGQRSGPAPVLMETPSATMSIRGTDWDVTVASDGRTELAVMSGSVLMENDFGRLEVAAGEGAAAEVGKAPYKFILLDPRERVQWVTAYRPQPRRWVPAPGPPEVDAIRLIEDGRFREALAMLANTVSNRASSALLEADVRLFLGEPASAVTVLAPHAREGAGNPEASALLARAFQIQDRTDDALRLLRSARSSHPDNIELLLAEGLLAVFRGDATAARAAFAASILKDATSAEAWYGAGLVEAERENVGAARELLSQAVARDPTVSRYTAELATLEAFATNHADAERLFDESLRKMPDDYVALTGRGILKLRVGDPQGALEDFLRAGVIEPRYARAWLYSGVAFYQLGDRQRALEAFSKAAELDPRDPLPLVFRSVARNDALALGEAIEDAREANQRMPYLKSLNQVLNNQKGNANLGSALATFGLEEWARHIATDAYSPWWAGSHLFLADRYQGTFNKNTELFKGFLTDPTVLGASNRYSSLVASPGSYGALDVAYSGTDFAQRTVTATANGLSVSHVPVAWYVKGDAAMGESRLADIAADGRTLTLGLGVKPVHELGAFVFATDSSIRGRLRETSSALPDDLLNQSDTRADAGMNFKLAGTNQIWIKAGSGRQDTLLDGALVSDAIAASLNRAFGVNAFLPRGQLDHFRTTLNQSDVQLRHSFSPATGMELSWGMENSQQRKLVTTSATFVPASLSLDQTHHISSREIWLSGKVNAIDRAWALQADLAVQRTESRLFDLQRLRLQGIANPLASTSQGDSRDFLEINPRVAAMWSPGIGHALRVVAQKWRRPAGVNSLGQTDTLGIPVNDRLVTAGGEYRRARLQHDWEFGSKGYVEWYLDRERIANLLTPQQSIVGDLDLTELESIRKRKQVFGAPFDYYERTPQFGTGTLNSFGLAGNYLASTTQSLALAYVFSSTRNTNAQFSDNSLPFIPRHTARVGSNWVLPQRWMVGVRATYRSARYRDEQNLQPLAAGWAFGATTYWESDDKRWIFEGRLDNLHSDKRSAAQRKAGGDVVLGYRF